MTYNLGSSKCNFLVVLLVFSLVSHVLNALVKLRDLNFELLDRWPTAFSLHLLGLILFLELVLKFLGDLEAFFEFVGLHLGLSLSPPFLVILLKLLLDLLLLLLDQKSLVLVDPFLVKIFIQLEVFCTLLLLEFGVEIEHHLLQSPLLIAQSLDL